jgi:hypothetical protein
MSSRAPAVALLHRRRGVALARAFTGGTPGLRHTAASRSSGLDVAIIRINRLLAAVVAALALLFAVLEPQASRGLPLPAALAFWLVHIGIGMLLAVQATGWVSRIPALRGRSPWLRVLAGGVAGSLLFAPVALAIDALLPLSAASEPVDDLLDQWEAGGGALALLAEWLQMSPSYVASWLLINAVPLATGPTLAPQAPGALYVAPVPDGSAWAPAPATRDARAHEGVPAVDAGVAVDTTDAVVPPEVPAAPGASTAGAPPDGGAVAVEGRAAFLSQLPPAIGTELIAIQADLHYLHVRTRRGRATVLASIATAEAALGDWGLRVHRSHWVALAHVARLARTARGMFLTLSDGSRVPVSRRRAAAVQAALGRDFVVDPLDAP